MKSSLPVIALFTANQGHFSLAQAAQEALNEHYQIYIYQEKVVFEPLYLFIYRYFPWFFKIPYSLTDNWLALWFSQWLYRQLNQASFEAFIKKYQPDICLSTYFPYNAVLEPLSKTYQIPYLNIMANPLSTHLFEISPPPAQNLVFDEYQVQTCLRRRPQSLNQAIGWLVKAKYQGEYSQAKVQKGLGLTPGVVTLLFVGGSQGNQKIKEILPDLLSFRKAVQVIVICGDNRHLVDEITRLTKNHVSPTTNVKVLGYTDQLHTYMQAADLVIGKAGPNTLFESVATRTPFMAIAHIAGQEDGNLQIIEDHDLGYVEENPYLATQLLKRIISEPDILKEKCDKLVAMAEYNEQAKVKLLTIVGRSLKAKQA